MYVCGFGTGIWLANVFNNVLGVKVGKSCSRAIAVKDVPVNPRAPALQKLNQHTVSVLSQMGLWNTMSPSVSRGNTIPISSLP